ncbi:GbsR/MarR family transcriptional regulator [Maribacter hydrothermalis]|uniref:Transcriptional regulator n=1 Tax=Maribacter hydrothermalis TaxID=1836467 RepID=A0A1B7Z414_9FLAO|nr:transcriptional regulator [Maribacter hydrothermalis]APQ17185.1 transcriptional regulator [Maribacter hydrothermalis]OBR37445.1 transcriptional regulator [Maribacter hydrothermalis]
MSKEEHKQRLIEELGVHFEAEYNLPPLAARIFGNLVVTEEVGLTFDDCQEKRGASKSSISTSLNLLLQLGMITYFTKSGDRRRYFKIADKSTFFIKKLEQAIKKAANEAKTIQKVADYDKEYLPEKYSSNKPKMDTYLECLKQNERTYQKTIEDLKKLL